MNLYRDWSFHLQLQCNSVICFLCSNYAVSQNKLECCFSVASPWTRSPLTWRMHLSQAPRVLRLWANGSFLWVSHSMRTHWLPMALMMWISWDPTFWMSRISWRLGSWMRGIGRSWWSHAILWLKLKLLVRPFWALCPRHYDSIHNRCILMIIS